MKVAELDAPVLNFWVAKAEGLVCLPDRSKGPTLVSAGRYWDPARYHPTTDWSQGGPIVARIWNDVEERMQEWFGPHWPHLQVFAATPLKWFMRCHVAAQFGDEVDDGDPADM